MNLIRHINVLAMAMLVSLSAMALAAGLNEEMAVVIEKKVQKNQLRLEIDGVTENYRLLSGVNIIHGNGDSGSFASIVEGRTVEVIVDKQGLVVHEIYLRDR